ncbi:non-homologous end-joining DNA ligase [Altererythrobacter sp. TH136]|uniref:non-homologous end-joining DNA ligase n=1 Tax=Altererythrobacter sp. TH136 TaxID=2067415 RepID=UPI00116574A4|nr:non-homologous end-joining DNA ligase [Altererythrobacter sp. TH136]QDM40623.1 DNA ligase D [Altererythrobacter sp. TH136]
MARISDQRRKASNRKAAIAPALAEAEHFHACPACGELVDRRNLGDVVYHEQPDHGPLASGPTPAVLRFVEPLLPTLADTPPERDGWIHEIKYDGYRTQIHIAEGVVRAYTRNAHDWTERYHPLVHAAECLPCASAILDGEVIVQDAKGRSDFASLRATIAQRPHELVFMAFDLLHLDGRDLRNQPIEERRAALERLIGPVNPSQPIHFSEGIVGKGADLFKAADRMGLEGIVSKKLGSRYTSGYSKRWLKTKTFTQEEFLVIGTSKGDRAPVALLAREKEGGLEYAGGAMVTLSHPARDRFWQAAETLRTDKPILPMEPRKETGWLLPGLRVRVKTLRGEELARHATVIEVVEPAHAFRTARTARSSEPHMRSPNIDRATLREYYAALAPVMLKWVARRPLNLVRCSGRSCWFQRNLNHPPTDPGTFGKAVARMPIMQKNGRTEDYLHVEDTRGVLECVEADTVEFHGWGSLVTNVEAPDRLVIDLDPDEGLDFEAVREAALIVRDALEQLNLASFPLLTGGKGVHVVVPLIPQADWEAVRGFALSLCTALSELSPDRFTVALLKKERAGRIFLDYLRNGRTATAVLPYSVRARKGAPVAAPVTWSELKKIDSAAAFTTRDAAQLIKRANSKALAGWGQVDQLLPGQLS